MVVSSHLLATVSGVLAAVTILALPGGPPHRQRTDYADRVSRL